MFSQCFIESYLQVSENKENFFTSIDGGSRNKVNDQVFITSKIDKNYLEELLFIDKFANNKKTKEFYIDYLKYFTSKMEYKFQFYVYCKVEIVNVQNNLGNMMKDIRQVNYVRIILLDDESSFYKDFSLNIIEENCIENILIEMINFHNMKNNLKNFNLTKSGYTVIFYPALGGYFIHEVLGHLLEFDNYKLRNQLHKESNLYKINKKISSTNLSVVDDPFLDQELFGLHTIDDEGNELNRISLLEKGIVTGYLGTNECSNDRFANCARRQNFKFPTIPRMRGTSIVPNISMNFNEIVSEYDESIVVDSIIGGSVNPVTGDFQLLAGGMRFLDGKAKNKLNSILLTGQVATSLESVDYVGNDFKTAHGHCGKAGQFVDVLVGSPTISISRLSVEEAPNG